LIAIVVSSGKATLHELDTVYGLEDLHDLIEIITIDAVNEQIMIEAEKLKH
jgi:hypothetical protein